MSIISTTESELSIGFVISLPFFFGALFFFLFSLYAFPYLLKPISISLVLLSSIVTYAVYTYGTLFDYSMIQNKFETNYGEATAYLNLSATGAFLLLGVVPSIAIARTKIVYKSFGREALHKSGGLVASIAIVGLIAGLILTVLLRFYKCNYVEIFK